jgi:hypothetical protein
MKRSLISLTLLLSLQLGFNSCKKEYDSPPLKPAADANKINIINIKAKHKSDANYKFISDSSLYCVVTADEVSGNLFKDIYVKDATGALHIKLINSGGLFIGDSIRINIKGAVLNDYHDLIQLDSVDSEANIVKLASGYNPQPVVTSIGAMTTGTATVNSFQSKLVQLNNVEFVSTDQNKPLGDAAGKTTQSRIIKSCDGKTLTVRTSGYCSFAPSLTPRGNGNITGIASVFNGNIQLLLRNYNELNMNGSLCTITTSTANPLTSTFTLSAPVNTISESFSNVSDNVVFSSAGWINVSEAGSVKWKGDVINSFRSLVASAYKSGETNNVMWLIAPPVIYSAAKTLSFKSGFDFWKSGHANALMAYVSTDFNGSNFSTANWTPVTTATYANGSGSYYSGASGLTSSGTINLNSISILNGYSGNFFVAWKYTGSDPAYTSNIYLDDILIQ